MESNPHPRRLLTLAFAVAMLVVCSCHKRPAGGPTTIDPDAPTEFSTTASGLKYRILRKSDGPRPVASDRIQVDYTGWLDDGSVFDSSYDQNEPATFVLSGVVAGWTEGLQLIGEGGMIELEIPPGLGYGERGSPPDVPPNATLHFKVELISIE
jgi:FKBP-type peptidyl-prolyl cis-trans isomerase